MAAGIFLSHATDALAQRRIVAVDLEGSHPGAAALTLQSIDAYRCVADARLSRGWQRYDTVLAHHYFMVEADPDSTPADITQDDAILIETTAVDPAPQAAPPPPREGGLQDSSLYAWFWWDRLRRVPGADAQKPTSRPSLKTAVDELYKAFDVDRVTNAKGAYSILQAPDAPPRIDGAYVFVPEAGGNSKLVPPTMPTTDVIGGVVAVEIMHVDSDPDTNGQVIRYAVRVTTLETPLKRTRVRVKVLRNYRDVDADLHNDIAQRFLMASPLSEWSERTDRTVRLGTSDFIAMKAERGWTLDTGVTLTDWLSIDTSRPPGDPSMRRNFGPILQTLIAATTPANSDCRLWGPEAQDPEWYLHGIIQDVGRDAHIILQGDGQDRSERVKRQFLVAKSGIGPVSWSQVSDLTAALDRQKIVSARFEITFIWADAKGQPMMELTFPVRFKR